MPPKLFLHFTHDGEWFEANLTAGTWAKAPSNATLQTRQQLLTRVGVTHGVYLSSGGSSEVANLAAFGREVPWPEAV